MVNIKDYQIRFIPMKMRIFYIGIIKCGKIVCPANSFSCSVRGKSVDKNNANVKTTMTCKAKDGTKRFYFKYNELIYAFLLFQEK